MSASSVEPRMDQIGSAFSELLPFHELGNETRLDKFDPAEHYMPHYNLVVCARRRRQTWWQWLTFEPEAYRPNCSFFINYYPLAFWINNPHEKYNSLLLLAVWPTELVILCHDSEGLQDYSQRLKDDIIAAYNYGKIDKLPIYRDWFFERQDATQQLREIFIELNSVFPKLTKADLGLESLPGHITKIVSESRKCSEEKA